MSISLNPPSLLTPKQIERYTFEKCVGVVTLSEAHESASDLGARIKEFLINCQKSIVVQADCLSNFSISLVDRCVATIIRNINSRKPTQEEIQSIKEKFNVELISKSSICDKLKRIGKVALASLALIPCSLVGIVGIGLRGLIHSQKLPVELFEPENEVEFEPENEVEQESKNSNKLNFITHNMACSEFEIMNAVNGLSSTEGRVMAWKEWFDNLQSKPDVICLQELFDPNSMQTITNHLVSKGYYVACSKKPVGSWGFGLSSGLLTASKYSITQAKFESYEHRMGACRFANKGILGTSITVGDKQYNILNTHSQAGLGLGKIDKAEKHKYNTWVNEEQNKQITEFCDEFAKIETEGTFLLGDLNKAVLDIDKSASKIVEEGDHYLLKDLKNKGWTNLSNEESDKLDHKEKTLDQASFYGTKIDPKSPKFQNFDEIYTAQIMNSCQIEAKQFCHIKKLDHVLWRNKNITHENDEAPEASAGKVQIHSSKILLPMGKNGNGKMEITSDHAVLQTTVTYG